MKNNLSVNMTTPLLTKIGDCVCRNRQHRLQAKKQAYAFFQDWRLKPRVDNDAHTLAESTILSSHQIQQLRDKKVCPRCTLIYLQLLGDARGEQIAECAISLLCPTFRPSSCKK